MQTLKLLDTGFTTLTSICTIQFFSSPAEAQAIYTLFVQSLVATAGIGKIIYDIFYKPKK
jgi:hypothetical protein